MSFILEYAGLKVVIGGDTFPNKWYIEHAKNADVAIHETFLTPPDQAWSVNGPNKPPSPPAPGSQPDPMTDFIKQGRWAPAEKAQAPMVNQFKKENNLK